MKVKSILSSWISRDGLRLDCNPYMTGALEARIRLDELSCPKERLEHLCEGGISGLVNAGRITRQWVEDLAYGIPFLTSTSILQADLSKLRFISKRAVLDNPKLLIRKGYTLITRAGSIGRMSYARPDMDGMACTEDVLRVIPDREKVPPGYLYAFLSSRFGVPMVTSGTYGAIIQHIEPDHIAGLPVPRLGEEMEMRVHDEIEGAAKARSQAAKHKHNSSQLLLNGLGLVDYTSADTPTSFAAFDVKSSELSRFDAAFHSPTCRLASAQLAAAAPETRLLSDLARVFTPGIFKRRYVDAPEFGYPYFSGTELFQLDALPRGYLAKKWCGIEEYRVKSGWLLIQDAGQIGGLIGTVVRVPPYFDGSVVSNHLMRIAAENLEVAAFLFALLSSAYGYRAIVRNAFGSSIPQLDPKHIGRLTIPWPSESLRAEVASEVLHAWKLEDVAVGREREGVALVERAIEDAP
jgi:type I restriction enzyme S subunit